MTPQDKLTQLATRPVGRLLWDYSLPAVVGMLVMALYNIVDRIFIGQFEGVQALAGLTITFPLMNLATAVGVLVGVGASARVSIALGADNTDDANVLLGNAATLTVLNAGIYILCFAVFMDPLLRSFGADETTIVYARRYMMPVLPGLLLTNFAFSLNNVMRASGYPGRAMSTMIIGAVTNVVLDPFFIKWWGITGAAVATDIAMGASAMFVAWHFCTREPVVRFKRGNFALKWKVFISIISIGAAPAVVNAAASGINAIVNKTLASYGTHYDLAAAGIFVTFTSLAVTIVLGICQGMQPVVGYNYGASLFHRLRRGYWLAVGVSTLLTSAATVVGLCFPEEVGHLFTDDPALAPYVATALRGALWAFPLVGFQVISTTFFQSLGRATESIIVSFLRQVIFLVPLLLILPQFMGLDGVWTSFPLSDIASTLVTAIMIAIILKKLPSE
ncbi:MAG: MATE family efflux transporter [Muribaculaceae bacterium]|nr:MATE family efflux transporter [Muribaculaceae bacterium]